MGSTLDAQEHDFRPETRPREGVGRVLVVDDNLSLAENIAEILETDGYATEVAANAEEALGKALSHEVTAVIVDYRLPGMNGAQLVERLRRSSRDLPALLISAYSDEATMDAARDAGAEFLAKPIELEILKQFLRERASSA
jgi:DNA-binding response OmpR family regulator